MKRFLASFALTLGLVSCQQTPSPVAPIPNAPAQQANQTAAKPLEGRLEARRNPNGTYQVKLNLMLDQGFRTQAINCNSDPEQGPISDMVQLKVRLFGPGIPTDIYPVEAPGDGLVSLMGSPCQLSSASTLTFNDVPEGAVRMIAVKGLNESNEDVANTNIEAVFPLVHGANLTGLEVSYRTGAVFNVIEALNLSNSLPEMRRLHLISQLDLNKLQALVDALTGFVAIPRAYAFHPGMVNTIALAGWIETLAENSNAAEINSAIEALTLNTGAHATYRLTGGTLTGKILGARPGQNIYVRYDDLTSAKLLIPGNSVTSSEVTFALNQTQMGTYLLEGLQNFANPPRVATATVAHNASGVQLNFAPLVEANWSATGPIGGRITSLVRGDATLLYAGTETGGVYVSSNNGDSWALANQGLDKLAITALAALDGTSTAYVATTDGIYKTVNSGALWAKVMNVANPITRINQLFIDPDNTSNVYATTNDGIRQSLDGGANWTAVNGPSSLLVGQDIHYITKSNDLLLPLNNRFFAASRGSVNKLYRSIDGANWETLYDFGSSEIRGVAVDNSLVSHLIVAVQNGSTSQIRFSSGLLNIAPLTGFSEYGAVGLSSLAPTADISQLSIHSGTLYVATRGQSLFSNGGGVGGTWVSPGYPGASDYPHITALEKTGTNLMLGTQGGGVAEVTSGIQQKSAGMHAQYITALAQHPGDGHILAAATKGGGIFLSIDSGGSWTAKHDGLNDLRARNVRSLAFDGNGNLYAGTEGAGVHVLANPLACHTESGWEWHAFNGSFPTNASVHALLGADGQIFAGLASDGPFTASGLYKTAQANLNCNAPPMTPAPWSTDFMSGAQVYSLTVKSPGGAGTWHLAAGLGSGQIRKSTDSGGTWASPISTGLTGPVLGIWSGAADIASRIYAVGYNNQGIVRSDDGGAIWNQVGTGLPSARVKSIAGVRLNANHLFVGLENGGVYQSIDGGVHWSAMNATGFPFDKLAFPALLVDQSANPAFILGGTSGGSIQRIDTLSMNLNG